MGLYEEDTVYGDAVQLASRETGLDESGFPPACPWTSAQIPDPAFWLGGADPT